MRHATAVALIVLLVCCSIGWMAVISGYLIAAVAVVILGGALAAMIAHQRHKNCPVPIRVQQRSSRPFPTRRR